AQRPPEPPRRTMAWREGQRRRGAWGIETVDPPQAAYRPLHAEKGGWGLIVQCLETKSRGHAEKHLQNRSSAQPKRIRFTARRLQSRAPTSRYSVLIQRTVPVRARMTTEWVKIVFRLKRTPSRSEPSVMPVAANMTSPEAMSRMVYLRPRSTMPAARARSR